MPSDKAARAGQNNSHDQAEPSTSSRGTATTKRPPQPAM
jgi:hypothetical protein